jgi:4-amino-4-deoxy-L-arabinose transferase-like glycosyltransferase
LDMVTSTTNDQNFSWPARGLSSFVDFAVGSHLRAMLVLIVVALLAFLPGFVRIPPIDRDEARFAQATKQMIETGDYVDIRFQGEVRYKKPVGIYWLQAGVVKTAAALGVPDTLIKIWLYRIPSLIGAIGAVLLTYWTALAFVPRRAAVLAGIMMAASILLGGEARLAKTDAVLLATIIAAMGAMARIYLRERAQPGAESDWVLPVIFWTALAGGILLKGPLILMVVGLAAAAVSIFDRSARWLLALKPAPGVIWLAILVSPWFIAILSKAGGSFLAESVGQDLLGKLASGQESHGAPPGYYFVLFWVTFWPASALAVMAAPSVWAARRDPATRFLLAWVVPSWIVFEIVVTKLPHYVLPLYPAIAILIAAAIERGVLQRARWATRGASWWFALPALIGIAGLAALVWLERRLGLPAWPFIAGAVVLGLVAWWLYDSDGPERGLLRAAAASIMLAIGMYAVILPTLQIFPSAELARAVRASGCEHPLAASAGFQEPSLIFLLGTRTQLTDGAGAAEFLRQGGCRFALVEQRQERSFAQRAEATGLRYAAGPRIDGINVGAGRMVSIAVYRSGAP